MDPRNQGTYNFAGMPIQPELVLSSSFMPPCPTVTDARHSPQETRQAELRRAAKRRIAEYDRRQREENRRHIAEQTQLSEGYDRRHRGEQAQLREEYDRVFFSRLAKSIADRAQSDEAFDRRQRDEWLSDKSKIG